MATDKDPGVWQLRKRLGNLKMLFLAFGQNSNNLTKSVGLRGDDLMMDRTQDVRPVLLQMKMLA